MLHLRALTASLAFTLAVALFGALPAAAQIKTFDLTYSGADFGNAASATGTITIDESQLINPGFTQQDINPFVTAFSLTVSGASAGNGTFGLSDYVPVGFFGFFIDTNGGTLEFTKELVGQPTDIDPFGTSFDGSGGDFNFFVNDAGFANGAPTGTSFFQITTAAGAGDSLHLTSFAPAAVPEPSSSAAFACGALGLGGLLIAARRRKMKTGFAA